MERTCDTAALNALIHLPIESGSLPAAESPTCGMVVLASSLSWLQIVLRSGWNWAEAGRIAALVAVTRTLRP